MDFIKIRERISSRVGKYKYVCIVLLVGIVLMIMPTNSSKDLESNVQIQAQKTE